VRHRRQPHADRAGGLGHELCPQPRQALSGDLEFDIEVQDETEGRPRAAGRARAAAAKREASGGSDDVRDEILERHALLAGDKDDVTHYRILDVDPGANAATIKKAYFKAAKRYHPDALGRLGLEDIKEKAASVFARIAEAFEVLGDERKRKAYDARLAGDDEEIDTAALAQAEKLYRKGEVLLRMGDFKGAAGFLASCVELWPEEAAYQAALGWALFKKSPPEPELALEHLERALSLDPDVADAQRWLDLVNRSLA